MNILTNRLSHFSMSGKWPISSLGPATVRPPKRRRFAWLGDGQWPRTEMAGAENGKISEDQGHSSMCVYINIIYH
jgi:hypothetical protein